MLYNWVANIVIHDGEICFLLYKMKYTVPSLAKFTEIFYFICPVDSNFKNVCKRFSKEYRFNVLFNDWQDENIIIFIDQEITRLQRNRKENQDNRKKFVTRLLIYSICVYVLVAVLFFLLYFPDTWELRLLYSLPLLVFPFLWVQSASFCGWGFCYWVCWQIWISLSYLVSLNYTSIHSMHIYTKFYTLMIHPYLMQCSCWCGCENYLRIREIVTGLIVNVWNIMPRNIAILMDFFRLTKGWFL